MFMIPYMQPSPLWNSSQPPARPNTIKRILQVAIEEWAWFGSQVVLGKSVIQRGGQEHHRHYFQRVGDYWREGAGVSGKDGRDRNDYWSAAFICFVMRKAGVPESEFPSTRRHSKYIHHAIQNVENLRGGAAFHGWRLHEHAPKVGDLVCYSRSGWMRGYDQAKNHERYSAHGDIVVHTRPPHEIWTIGGNVRDSVSLRILYTDYQGYLDSAMNSHQRWFCVIENKLPRQ